METAPRNQKTQEKHRREVFWQITFPLILLFLLFGTGGWLVINSAFGTGGDVGVWRDISIFWLSLPAMLACLIPLVIFGGLVYGVTRLLGITPGYMLQAQDIFKNLSVTVKNLARKARAPFYKIQSLTERVRSMRTKRME